MIIDNDDAGELQANALQDRIYDAVTDVLKSIAAKEVVRIDVLQAALGSVLADTFVFVDDDNDRRMMLENFVNILRQCVESISDEKSQTEIQ